ncbi:MAG: CotH kinase family protein [Planctomycetota bacterium]|nr:CotH kinase family protein [Planctomycetota bacterium]
MSTPFWRKLTLKSVLFFTLPPMALGTALFLSSVADYRRARQYDDWWSAQTSVRKFGFNRLRTALDTYALTKIESRMDPERDDVPLLRLYVDRREFDKLDGDVGGTWGQWVEVQIDDHGELIDAEVRFRGDGSAHWTTEKKSLTLKTKSGSLYKGFRTMAFSVKDVLPQYLAASLAKDFGLLAPEQQVVPVFLNDRFYGLHRFVEPIDESFLRRNLRMPGNVFRADTAERGDYFKDLPREVFRNPYIWDRAANNDRPGAFGTKLLGDFLADLNDPSPAARERLDGWLDEDELSRMLAYLLVVGDPYHMSGVHNQFWYEDPVSGTLHPITWDVRLLDLEKPPRGSNINRFWRIALEDPRIWAGTMKVLAEKLKDDTLLKEAEARLALVQERYADAIEYDQLRSGVIPPIGDAQEALATLRKNIETLRGWFSDTKVSYCAAPSPDGRVLTVDVVIEGFAPVDITSFTLKTDSHAFFGLDRFYRDSNGNGVLDAEDADLGSVNMVEWPGCVFVPPLRLQAWPGGTGAALEPLPSRARFFWDAGEGEPPAEGIELSLRNASIDKPIEASQIAPLTVLGERSLDKRLPPRGVRVSTGPERVIAKYLSGEVHLTEDLLIANYGDLRIAPGTTLKLDPDVSIECRGKLEALGTAENPITIDRANPDLPWGVFALQGPGADGSVLKHVKFLGGGARQVGRVEYKGSVCVHYSKGVVFDACEFAHNQRCDDLINVVKGEAAITNSHFHHANADSIDYDMSGGLVAWNLIEGSGNDGLDLMTCWPRVIGNRIVNSGDKGISVGEDSSPLVFQNLISGCVRGIEAKDRSEPFVFHSTLEKNQLGVYAHIKNWRYGEAGWPKFVRAVVEGNEKDYKTADSACRTIADSRVAGADVPNAGDVEWAYRLHGVRSDSKEPGLQQLWQLAEPVKPSHEGTFSSGFGDTQAGWRASGLVRRLCLRELDLEATFRAGIGRIETTVDWDLSNQNEVHELVVELSSEDLTEVRLVANGADFGAAQLVKLAGDRHEFRFATMRLPAGRYTTFGVEASAAKSGSKVRLHSWRVISWPKETP